MFMGSITDDIVDGWDYYRCFIMKTTEGAKLYSMFIS